MAAVLGREGTSYILLLYISPSFAKAASCSIACAHQDVGRALGIMERHCLQKAPSLQCDSFGLHSHCLKGCTSLDFKSIKMKDILQNYVSEFLRSSTCSVLLNLDWNSFSNPYTRLYLQGLALAYEF